MPIRAVPQEQADQHDKRQRYRPVLQAVEGDLQPFYRRQYRDRRGDHAVAVEQRRADQAGNHHESLQPAERRRRPARQGRQRHHPALALVVGTQDEDHVLDGNDPDQRPEDQREHAKDAIVVGLHPVAADEDLFQGIQGTGANIPIADSNRPDHQADGRAGMPLRSLLGTRRCITHETLSPEKFGKCCAHAVRDASAEATDCYDYRRPGSRLPSARGEFFQGRKRAARETGKAAALPLELRTF